VWKLEILICEFSAIDAFTAGTVEVSEITSLHHEAFNHSVEDAAFKGQWLASCLASAGLTSA